MLQVWTPHFSLQFLIICHQKLLMDFRQLLLSVITKHVSMAQYAIRKHSILVNVGTGSQISCWTKCFHSGSETIETRPYLKNDYILSGSSLCGGRAYALLESFFREFLSEAGYSADSLYDVMNRMAASYDTLSDPLIVETTFCGSRQNPDLRGSISNIGTDNFTPAHLTAGFLQGCVNELYAYFEQILPIIKRKPRYLVGSGNGLRRNPALQSMFSRTFKWNS